MDFSEILLNELSDKVLKFKGFNIQELEKFVWMIVHEHKHGSLPVEYDIREIDEKLFEAVLNKTKNKL